MTGGPASLLSALDRCAGVPVVCVGDVMLDRYVSGAVERISPEAPVPVLRVGDQTTMLGGAGNVVHNLRALAVDCRFAGIVGDDAPGREVRDLLTADLPANGVCLAAEPGRRTTVKTRFVCGTQQLLRTDDESVAPIGAVSARTLAEAVRAWVARSAVVLLSDYAKGVFADALAAGIIGMARQAGVCAIVDPKGADYGRYRMADVVTPNRRELAEALGAPVAAGREGEGAHALIARHGFGAVLVTLGRDGLLLVERDGEPRHLPAEAREVFDVSGAGDTVVATLGAALAAGAPLADAAALANVTAGLVVGKVGTAVAHPGEIAQALRQRGLAQTDAKVTELPALLDLAARWRRQGLRVGFTNGCFDLIHPGHISLLRQARAACDRLVVGLNSDASVARLKGPGRPVQPELARAIVLASLASVDAVVVFDDDTPLALIEALTPDVLVKGADYTLETVVGAPLVRGYGGRVLLVDLEPGYSTTATLASLAR